METLGVQLREMKGQRKQFANRRNEVTHLEVNATRKNETGGTHPLKLGTAGRNVCFIRF